MRDSLIEVSDQMQGAKQWDLLGFLLDFAAVAVRVVEIQPQSVNLDDRHNNLTSDQAG